ncbi:MAG TPA: hypothetical protein VKR58_11905 [Aquella sp.]|nr:hypothetical protein [Aquella sp.]
MKETKLKMMDDVLKDIKNLIVSYIDKNEVDVINCFKNKQTFMSNVLVNLLSCYIRSNLKKEFRKDFVNKAMKEIYNDMDD